MTYAIYSLLIILAMACVLCIWRIMSLRSANEMLKFSDNFHKQQLQEKEKRISELEAECVEIEGKHNKNGANKRAVSER